MYQRPNQTRSKVYRDNLLNWVFPIRQVSAGSALAVSHQSMAHRSVNVVHVLALVCITLSLIA